MAGDMAKSLCKRVKQRICLFAFCSGGEEGLIRADWTVFATCLSPHSQDAAVNETSSISWSRLAAGCCRTSHAGARCGEWAEHVITWRSFVSFEPTCDGPIADRRS